MPLRNFNLRQPLSSENFPYYNILLLFYLTCQFGLISLAASEKRYVTRPQKTLNLIACPQTFWPFIFTIDLSYIIPKEAVGRVKTYNLTTSVNLDNGLKLSPAYIWGES